MHRNNHEHLILSLDVFPEDCQYTMKRRDVLDGDEVVDRHNFLKARF